MLEPSIKSMRFTDEFIYSIARVNLHDVPKNGFAADLDHWLRSKTVSSLKRVPSLPAKITAFILAYSVELRFCIAVIASRATRHVTDYSIPSFFIRYRSDLNVIPSNCAALVLL
jgi:hypothetical protein